MKTRHTILTGTTVALLLLITLLFAACPSGGGGGSSPDLTGTVSISAFIKVGVAAEATVTDSNATSFTYQWQKSDTETGTFANLATGASYTPVAADVDKYLRVRVTASGFKGERISNVVQVQSASAKLPIIESVAVSPKTPAVTQGHTQQFYADVVGKYDDDSELEAALKAVTWSVTGGDNGTAINATTGLLSMGRDQTLTATITVTATSTADPTKRDTTTVTVIDRNAPALTGTVTIPGAVRIGDTVAVTTTALEGTGTISYQWQRTNENGSPIIDIADATAATYVVGASEFSEGDYIQVRVTRTGNSGYVDSNRVAVLPQGIPLPVVTGVTIKDKTGISVEKGSSHYFEATVTGTNLRPNSTDSNVIWSVTGGTKPGTYMSGSDLWVAADETAASLTVTATSTVTTTVKDTATVSVTAASGYVLTITGLTDKSGWVNVSATDSVDGSGSDSYSGSGFIYDGTVVVVLNNLTGTPQLYLSIGNSIDTYAYTNGAALDMTNLASTPKYSFTGTSSTVGFDKFKPVVFGYGGHQLTITGFTGKDDSIVNVSIGLIGSPAVAEAQGKIVDGTLTVLLHEPGDPLTGWTATGSRHIWFDLIDPDKNYEWYLYTNGQTYAQLGITGDFELGKAPRYAFTGTSTTLAVTTFYAPTMEYQVWWDDYDNRFNIWSDSTYYNPGDTVTLYVTPRNGWELNGIDIVNSSSGGLITHHGGTYPAIAQQIVTFTMPASEVEVSPRLSNQALVTRTVTVTPATGGTITANPLYGVMGTHVTLTVTPNAGYLLTGLSIKDAAGRELEEVTAATRSFNMPASNVTITGTFTQQAANTVAVQFTGFGNESISLVQSSANDLSIRQGDELTVTVGADYDNYQWYLDGENQWTDYEHPERQNFWADQFIPGTHTLTVVVWKDDGNGSSIPYSKEVTFKVVY